MKAALQKGGGRCPGKALSGYSDGVSHLGSQIWRFGILLDLKLGKIKSVNFIDFNPVQANLLYRLKVQGGLQGPFMNSGTIKASQIKLCTVKLPLKTFQNTKEKFQKSYLLRHDDVSTKTMGKFGPPRNRTSYVSFEK